jgi:ankyrin repeat protein
MVIEMFLARADVNVDSKDVDGRTPLSFAAEQGHVSTVKLLLARNDIDADSKDDDGRTPLSFAVEVQSHCLFDLCKDRNPEGHQMVIEMFLARTDVNANSKDKNGRTPLSFAAQCGCAYAVKLLLARDNVDADSRDEAGRTPLSYVVDTWGESIIQPFCMRRFSLYPADEEGSQMVIDMLLSRTDVNVDSKDKNGRTPLSFAAE